MIDFVLTNLSILGSLLGSRLGRHEAPYRTGATFMASVSSSARGAKFTLALCIAHAELIVTRGMFGRSCATRARARSTKFRRLSKSISMPASASILSKGALEYPVQLNAPDFLAASLV